MKNLFCAVVSFLSLVCAGPGALAQGVDAGAGAAGSVSAGEIAGVAIPGAMVLYGVLSLAGGGGGRRLDFQTRDEIVEDGRVWTTKVDNYAQFAPAAAAFVLKFTGVRARDSLLDMTLLYGLSNAAQATLVWSAKGITGRERPDGSNNQSFPSGHTATAFVAAEFLHQEFGYKCAWIDVAGYGVAAWVGAARVYKNRHWLSDVVAGAGVGMLTTKGVYWAYPRLKLRWFGRHEHGEELAFVPVVGFAHGGGDVALVCRF